MSDEITPLRAANRGETEPSAELVAQAETIEQCTSCGRLVLEVDEQDECAPCVAHTRRVHHQRAEATMEILNAIFDEAAPYLHLDDVIEMANKRLYGRVRLAEYREPEFAGLDDRLAEVDRYNAEVKRLRAISGKDS